MYIVCRRAIVLLGWALLLIAPLVASAQAPAGVGFAPITIHDPANGQDAGRSHALIAIHAPHSGNARRYSADTIT